MEPPKLRGTHSKGFARSLGFNTITIKESNRAPLAEISQLLKSRRHLIQKGPEITNGLGAFLYEVPSEPGFGRASSSDAVFADRSYLASACSRAFCGDVSATVAAASARSDRSEPSANARTIASSGATRTCSILSPAK